MTETALAPATQAPVRSSWASGRRLVSALWLFLILCFAYCDILGFYDAEDLESILAGSIGGITITPTFALSAGVLMTIPMGMVLLSRIAPFRLARWATVVAATVMTLVQIGSLFVGKVSYVYGYFSAIEIATAAFLVFYAAWRWRTDS